MLGKMLLYVALFLASSSRYKNFKLFFKDLLENPQSPYKKYFDLLMIVVVISSILLLIQEVKHTLSQWLLFYNYTVVTLIFLTEYILRMWVHSDIHQTIITEYEKSSFLSSKVPFSKLLWKIFIIKLDYIKSPAAIIDLLAILPSYRPLRVLRIFLLFRVIKLLRYTKSIQNFLMVLHSKAFELFTLLLFLAFVMFISAVLLYVFEGNGQNPNINTFFDAVYWALVTISTVGYGDISPVTFEGRIVSILVIIAGVTILAFATSIIVSAFTEKLDELREEKSIQEVRQLKKFYLFCGYSQMAQMLSRKLTKQGFNVVIIDKDRSLVAVAQKQGFTAILGDASKLHTYKQIHEDLHEHIITALVLINNEINNIYITLTLKSLSNNLQIYTRANSRSMERKLKLAGAQHILYAYETIGQVAKEYVDNPIAFDAVNQLSSGLSKTKLGEITLFEHDLPVQRPLKEIDFFALKLILIGVTRDETFIFKPKPDFVFNTHDTLLVIGSIEHIQQLKDVVLKNKRSAR